jgi:DNA-binding transcriptional MocR family regulator
MTTPKSKKPKRYTTAARAGSPKGGSALLIAKIRATFHWCRCYRGSDPIGAMIDFCYNSASSSSFNLRQWRRLLNDLFRLQGKVFAQEGDPLNHQRLWL